MSSCFLAAKILEGYFIGLDRLEELEFLSNGLDRMNAGVLKGLSSLKRLDLSCNKIEYLPQHVFACTPSLEQVDP